MFIGSLLLIFIHLLLHSESLENRSSCDDAICWFKSRQRALNIWQTLLCCHKQRQDEFAKVIKATELTFAEVRRRIKALKIKSHVLQGIVLQFLHHKV